MGFELPNGKTARNIQEQVKFLTEKLKDLYSRVNELEIHIEVVDELPETGVEGTIYLLPATDPEEGNYYEEYIWLDDAWELIGTTQVDLSQYYTKTEADAKFVDFTTDQNITGVKTFNEIDIKVSIDDSKIAKLISVGNYYFGIRLNNDNAMLFDFAYPGGAALLTNLLPLNDNTRDIGSYATRWKDGHFAGQVYAQNTLNVINASDIVSNTLTQAQYDLITNGKPTLIKGNILTYKSLLLPPVVFSGTSIQRFFALTPSTDLICAVLNPADKTLTLGSASDKFLSLRSIWGINGKEIPNYPSSPATPKFLKYGTDNALSWGDSLTDLTLTGTLTDGTNSVTVAQLAAIAAPTLYEHEITFYAGTKTFRVKLILSNNTEINTVALLEANYRRIIYRPVNGGTSAGSVSVIYDLTGGQVYYYESTSPSTNHNETISTVSDYITQIL